MNETAESSLFARDSTSTSKQAQLMKNLGLELQENDVILEEEDSMDQEELEDTFYRSREGFVDQDYNESDIEEEEIIEILEEDEDEEQNIDYEDEEDEESIAYEEDQSPEPEIIPEKENIPLVPDLSLSNAAPSFRSHAEKLDLAYRVQSMKSSLFKSPAPPKRASPIQEPVATPNRITFQESPSKTLTSSPKKYVKTSTAKKLVPLASSQLNGRQTTGCVDAGLFMSRSYRVGWGPGDSLIVPRYFS